MVLVLEFGNERSWCGAVGDTVAKWRSFTAGVGDLSPLDKALRAFGFFAEPPSCVVTVLADRAAGAPHVSWSVVRQSVATANTLAFAWHAPAAAVRSSGQESREDIAGMARRAAAKANKSEWVRALYSGTPNISTAKKVL